MPVADSSTTLLERRSTWWIAGIFIAVLFATANLPWQLDEFSQERQALASFQMIKDGRWFYQEAPRTHREEREATKPPLVPWISAATYMVTRSWNFAWRFPSALGAAFLAIALVRVARVTFGSTAAFLALCAFSFNTLSPRLATLVRTDMPLALVVFLLGAQILDHVRTQRDWTRRDRIIVFALLTLGLYVKGPIVFAFLLPGLAILRGRMKAWCGWWPWLVSLGIFLLWIVGGIISRPDFYNEVVLHEFLGRFGTTEHTPHAIYFYAAHLFQKFAPWSELLLLMSIFPLVQDRQPIRRAMQNLSPATWWIMCWSLGGLAVMSLVPSKRFDRIFPIIPPLCLVVAAQFNSRYRRWFVLAAVVALGLTSCYYGYVKVYRGYHDERNSLSIFGEAVRRNAQARGWRYEVTPAHDGGLLLYLDRTQFIDPERAIAMWNENQIDALIVEEIDLANIQPRLRDVSLTDLRATEHIDEKERSYVVVARRER